MSVPDPSLAATPRRARWSRSRMVWHTVGLILAALLAYAVWRGYQSPDFLLDWSNLRLCDAYAGPRSSDGHA